MEMLQVLLEDEGVQNLITENEDVIIPASNVFHEFPQVVKDYIQENLDEFIVPGDLKATYENMVTFSASAAANMLNELTDLISGQTPIEEA